MQSLTAAVVRPSENRLFPKLTAGTALNLHSFSWCDAGLAASRSDSKPEGE
jgi:hypothetical protein